MDINSIKRSLPPLVEGKVHGYLQLMISEVVWYRMRPGNVTVVASWWGEDNSAHFRPVDTAINAARNEDETVEVYAIKTNFDLFREYLSNCGGIELTIISETLNEVIGTTQVSDLQDIFQRERYIQYCSIYNKVGTKVGDLPVNIALLKLQKGHKSPAKLKRNKSIVPFTLDLNSLDLQHKLNLIDTSDQKIMSVNNKQEENVYRSILKDKRFNINKNITKFNSDITDNLVAQVVERARKLRGRLMKEAVDNDPLEINGHSLDSLHSDKGSLDDEQSILYKYFMGTSMSQKNEKKALETLRSISPTHSLIDLATETIIPCHNNKSLDKIPYSKRSSDELLVNKGNREMKLINDRPLPHREACPMDYVDSLRIAVESLTLTSAGYRRVKSSCITRGDGIPATVTYFVQYDAAFANVKKYNKKVINENKRPVKMTSKRQDGQVIYFNHEAVYDVPRARLESYMNIPLKFKIFNRHFDQKTPTELGIGSTYIGDAAASPTFSSTQKLAIVKKGIKIGELKVTIELGCDKIHFGKHFIEAIILAKENIPVLDASSNSSINSLSRYKCATGSESKPNSGGNSEIASGHEQRQYNDSRSEESIRNFNPNGKEISRKTGDRIKIDIPKVAEEKILLHGLIYIGEGRNLPAMNTYIICRALWRQDRASSRVCTDTNNPSYNFHQIMPLIYGLELLERTRDNCIITEVYLKNLAGEDNLIGISKLSVHQLYVALRDPLVLPNLLKSKYPVISVDGWVPITDPVTGRLCGELSALIALGTADQIALLEMTRGLRGIRNFPEHINRRHLNLHQEHQRESSMKTQECQTEITTVSDNKSTYSGDKNPEESRNEQTTVLHTIVDRLAQALTGPKTITNQEAQTEFEIPIRDSDMEKVRDDDVNPQALSLNPSNSNSFSGDSFNDTPRENFNISRGIYRSVGVGAEFNEPVNQNANTNCDSTQVPTLVDSKNNDKSISKSDAELYRKLNNEFDINNSNDEEGFRAVVEIESALHLPTVELLDGSVEPSTYVIFEKFREGNYGMTDVCSYSCNPKYDWRCDTKLPTELLTNEKMRLIMKVWRLIDPETSMSIDMQKDMIIGFSAIDLSVLAAGFPMVSGWFHITDFTGKCNGQLKVCITPLDNISMFSRSCKNSSRVQMPVIVNSNSSSPYPQDIEKMNEPQDHHVQTFEETAQVPIEGAFDIGVGFGDASMSFLSLSLKQKLTELDEIKQRLQSRLQDVTSTAFEDDFDNDFDSEAELDQEDNDNNGNNVDIMPSSRLTPQIDNNSVERDINHIDNHLINGNGGITSETESIQYPHRPTSDNNTNSIEANLTDTGYSSGSNIHPIAPVTNGHSIHPKILEMSHQNMGSISNGQYTDSNYPVRGTRMHISHLLDKLSMQLTTTPAPITNLSMKRNIMDLISSLRRNNNNFSNDIKCNRQANVRTVPTQTDTNFISDSSMNNSAETKRHNVSSNKDDLYNDDEIPAKTQKREKVSAIVREELIADDENDSSEYDELTRHLMTSNIRHMDVNILNPLLYPHVIPDISDLPEIPEAPATSQESTSPSVTPGDDTISRLDNRYAEGFSTTINKSLNRLRNLLHVESSSSQMPHLSSTTDNSEVFRVTPSGLPENTDGNIDVTVIHKAYNDDLMASNSIESTTTVSLDNTMQTGTEIDDASSLNSSETSVSAASRQAPDGGNTMEDPSKPILLKRRDQSEESSSEN